MPHTTQNRLLTWGYARISEDDELEGLGVGRQTDDIQDYGTRRGFDVSEVVIDNDYSASRYARKPRPGFKRLLEAIEAGEVGRIVIYDVDRLLRKPRELEDLIDLADKFEELEIHNMNGDLNLRTADGRFLARILVAKAAKESDDLSRRIKRATKSAAHEGKFHGGRVPAGYRSDPNAPGGLIVEETEAELIREGAQMLLDGESFAAVARSWNAAGFLRPAFARPNHPRHIPPKAWSPASIGKFIDQPFLAGLRVYHGAKFKAAWPAILDPEIHAALLARRRGHAANYRGSKLSHLLSGLLKCERCGSRMHAGSSKMKHSYVCPGGRGGCGNTAIRMHRAEAEVREWLGEHLSSTDWDSELKEARRAAADHADELKRLDAHMGSQHDALKELLLQTVATVDQPAVLTRDEYAALADVIKADIVRTQERIGRLSKASADPQMSDDQVEGALADYDDEDATLDARRAFLESFIETIKVRPAAHRGRPRPGERRLDIRAHSTAV